MRSSFRWWWPLTLPVLYVIVAVGMLFSVSRDDGPNSADRHRITEMRTDPAFAHPVGPAVAHEASYGRTSHFANTYGAAVDPWTGHPAPPAPTVADRRDAVAAIVTNLWAGGWTFLSVRCAPPTAVPPAVEGGPATFDSYRWRAFGYRVRAGVAYTVDVTGLFDRQDGFRVSLSMASPFHGDPIGYFGSPPPPVDPADTCLHRGDPDHPGPPRGHASTLWDGQDGLPTPG